MKKGLNILILGEQAESLTRLKNMLEPISHLSIHCITVTPENIPQILLRADLQESPVDVVVIRLNGQPESLLSPLNFLNLARLKLVIVGPANNVQVMRAAMQVGANDYLVEPVSPADIQKSLDLLFTRQKLRAKGKVTAVVPAAGGVGASFLACNLASVKAEKKVNTLLLDMDLMLGSALKMLDLKASYSLEDVFRQLDSLDLAAIDGLLAKHENGLNVLAAQNIDLLSGQKPSAEQILQLLSLLRSYADEIIVDLPMTPVSISSVIQQQANSICLVVQQDMLVLRNAMHWINVSEKEWGIPRKRFRIIVNSYTKGLDMDHDDICRILGVDQVTPIPHDFVKVTHSINAGVPIAQNAPSAAVSAAIVNLHTRFNPGRKKESAIRKLATRIFRRS